MISTHPITDADGPNEGLKRYRLGRWAARHLTRGPLGRLELAVSVQLLARAIVAAPRRPHPATLGLFVKALRLQGRSAGWLAQRLQVSPRAVRLWSAGDRLPRSKRVFDRFRALAKGLLLPGGPPMGWDKPFLPESMAGLLELECRGVEARLGAPILLGGIVQASGRLWPYSRDRLRSDARTGPLSSVRQAVAAVALARGLSRADVADVLGRSPSTAAYLATQGART